MLKIKDRIIVNADVIGDGGRVGIIVRINYAGGFCACRLDGLQFDSYFRFDEISIRI